MPVGLKNRTDGDVQVAVDAISAAATRHLFPSLTKEGAPAILETSGNPDCHLVLRGGSTPNFDPGSVAEAQRLLKGAGLPARVMVDCSHANSGKDPTRQADVARAVVQQRSSGNDGIRGIMLESHLVAGRQDVIDGQALTYGQSITDPCLGWEDTEEVLSGLADAVQQRRARG